jgi:hypothetical protein
MINAIHGYIRANAGKWLAGIPEDTNLQPLFRSNVNYNFVENYPLITRVILWFTEGDKYPCVVSKIMDSSIKRQSIDQCLEIQERLNKYLGWPVFPKVYDITEISGSIVLFEEGVRSSTYESELKRVVWGPESSLTALERTINQQFSEMGGLFQKLQKMATSNQPRKWGDWAYKMGQDFRSACGIEKKYLNDVHLDIMKSTIDAAPFPETAVIADMVCPNIFPGPRLIDNINPDINGLNTQLPGLINVFRFMVTYFYSPPVKDVFTDWIYTLAAAITDTEGQTIPGIAVRDILTKCGLDTGRPDIIWSFIMAATFFEMKDKLDFYNNSPFMLGGKKEEYLRWTKELIEIQGRINKKGKLDPGPIIIAQQNFGKYGVTTPSGPATGLAQSALKLFPSFIRPAVKKIGRLFYNNLAALRRKIT